jgi:two-component system cell cycle response regulator
VSLRARLTLFFFGIAIVPLVLAGILVRVAILREVDRRTDIKLNGDAQALNAAWNGAAQLAALSTHQAAQDLAGVLDDPRESTAALQSAITKERVDRGLDYLVVTRAGDGVLSSIEPPSLLPGAPAIDSATVIDPGPLAPLLLTGQNPLDRGGKEVLRVYGGIFVDQNEAVVLARAAGGVGFEVRIGQRTLVSSLSGAVALPVPNDKSFPLAGRRRGLYTSVGVRPGAERAVAVVNVQQGDIAGLQAAILMVVFGSVLVASFLGFGLHRMMSEPIRRLADQASAVLAGAPALAGSEANVATSADEELVVASTLSAMSEHLQQYATELSQSREELRQSLARLGTTLRSAHDQHGMLAVAVDSAALSLGAEAGVIYLPHPSNAYLFAEVTRGTVPLSAPVAMGTGVAGVAASEERTVLWPSAGGPGPGPGEPQTATAIAAPLVRGDRLIGVIALYGRISGAPFSGEDVETLAAFARETAVAVENVEAAERLSMSDPLTGTGNRRFLEMALVREIERARRFGREFGLLMVDIDYFKQVNDEHGHLRGDEVLVEVVRRIESAVRSGVDTVARYGGEEFVVLLTETDAAGALAAGERIRSVVGERLLQAIAGSEVATNGGGHGTSERVLRVTVSVGCATFPGDGMAADDLIRAADRAMYAAKRAGGDRAALSRDESRTS